MLAKRSVRLPGVECVMSAELIATVLTGAGVLLGVWRLVEGMRRDLTAQIRAVDAKLTAEIRTVNTRIDNILLADRNTA